MSVSAALAVPAVSGAFAGFAINAAIDVSACPVAAGLLFSCCPWAFVYDGIMGFSGPAVVQDGNMRCLFGADPGLLFRMLRLGESGNLSQLLLQICK